jgi:putative ATP-dependent endonuclease of OLD family
LIFQPGRLRRLFLISTLFCDSSAGPLSNAKIEPLALYLMDAKRDIQDEIRSRSSFWNRMVSDPGLSEEKVIELEKALNELNGEILAGSPVLGHVQEHMNDLYRAVASDAGSVSITPIAKTLRDMSSGIDVTFKTKGSQTFPLRHHGMGTRSLATILAFRAYSTWRQKNLKGDAVHPMVALEEPETHLHPQAQRSLFRIIGDIHGQRLISTHSPYIAGQAVGRQVGADTLTLSENYGTHSLSIIP